LQESSPSPLPTPCSSLCALRPTKCNFLRTLVYLHWLLSRCNLLTLTLVVLHQSLETSWFIFRHRNVDQSLCSISNNRNYPK
jgi:hypothetical protein